MKKFIAPLLIALSILLLITTLALIGLKIYADNIMEQAGRTESWHEADGTIIENIAYAPHALNTYDLYIPASATSADTLGCLLYIHGGSWTTGDKSEGAWFCKRFAKQGCITATMNYSLVSTAAPSVCIPTMLKEITHCINSIKDEAARRKIHIRNIALAGYSAGAHLAMLYALRMKDVSPLPIAFCTSMAGPTDLQMLFTIPEDSITAVREHAMQGNVHPLKRDIDALAFFCSGQQLSAPGQYTGANIATLLAEASPIAHVSVTAPATIFAHGADDQLVAPAHTAKMVAALDSLGIRNSYIRYPQSDHLLASDSASVSAFNAAVAQYIHDYFKSK